MAEEPLPLFEDASFLRNRSEQFFKIHQYNWVIYPTSFAAYFMGLYMLATHLEFFRAAIAEDVLWSSDCKILVLLLLPSLIGVIPPYANVLSLCLPSRPFARRDLGKTRTLGRLRICLVTKGSNIQTIIDTARCWEPLSKLDSRVSFHVLLDLPSEFELPKDMTRYVHVDKVPQTFEAQHATYKARALEWFRKSCKFLENDWVLHLDEETRIDQYALNACIDFIEKGSEHLGLGVLFYNTSATWRSTFLTVAEIGRISEEFGRFQFFPRLFKRQPFGWMHGSFILLNGLVENTVTWDTACVAEDFWFAQKASKLGFRFGLIDAIAREQPPHSFKDFVRQRRRWYSGVMEVATIFTKASLLNLAWTLARHIYLVVSLIWAYKPVIPHWLFIWLVWEASAYTFSNAVSCVMQDLDTQGIGKVAVVFHLVLTIVTMPICHLVEGVILLTCVVRKAEGFYVVKKL